MHNAIVIKGRPATSSQNAAESSTKNILLHVQNDVRMEQRLQVALSIARAAGAHLKCAQVTPVEAYVTTGNLGGLLSLDKAIDKIDSEDKVMEESIKARLTHEDVSWDYEQVTGYETVEVIRRAALADLVILGRDAHLARAQRPPLAVLGDIVSNCRTPLLIPGNAEVFDPFGPAIVAWNGSYEAANAARAAIDMLKRASEVRVLRFTEEKATAFPDTRLTEYLSRHGIHAELDVHLVRRDYAADLVEHSVGYVASFIVMGGYSHSRAGEFLFGGVTRELLRDCPVSLVISH